MSLTVAWEHLRRRPAAALAVGDTWINPRPFTAYWAALDGTVGPAMGCEPATGAAWTVVDRDGDKLTVRGEDGRERTDPIPERAHVLLVEAS